MTWMKRHLTYANIAATLALAMAGTGGAIAAGNHAGSGRIKACVSRFDREVYVQDHCLDGDKSLTWNR